MIALTERQLIWIGIALGAGYGIFARFAFGLERTGSVFQVMSASFILGVPVMLGFLTVWFGEYRQRFGWARRVLMPWAPSLFCLFACLLFAWEGLICLWLWLPLVLILSSVGGLLAGALLQCFKSDDSRNYCSVVVALLPFVAAPIESLRQASTQIRTVQTEIVIHATPEVVWSEISSVRRIEEREHHFDWAHLMGFPRPVEALLEGSGPGAVRYARFEGDVLFTERVTQWEPGRTLSFTVHADPAHIPPTTFDEHVTIGGQYFDVLEGSYVIEPFGPGNVLLHLSSKQRLSTSFNFYSHLWTEALMADLQTYILDIIKHRCETGRNQALTPASTATTGSMGT